MTTAIRYLGISAFEIRTSKGKKILIDPYIEKSPVCPVKVADLDGVDLILLTHAAADHLEDAGEIAKRFGANVICGGDVKLHLIDEGVSPEKIIQVVWGITVEWEGILVRSVESRHWSGRNLVSTGDYISGPPMGFIINADPGVKVYVCGDTTLFSDLRLIGELHKPNIGLINVSDSDIRQPSGPMKDSPYLTGEMTPDEAVLASQWLGLKYVIPIHFVNFEPDVQKFLELSKKQNHYKAIFLKPGETFKYDGPT